MNPSDLDVTSTESLPPADSELESAMHRLLVRYGLPSAEFHAHVGGRQVDVHLTGTPVVIEFDERTSRCDPDPDHDRDRHPSCGRDADPDHDQIERNRRGDAEFAAHGWIVLRFTHREIATRPADVAHRIRSALDRWASGSLT